jgi:hypothetical protein
MVNGVEARVGDAVGIGVEVGASGAGVTFPRGVQEVRKKKVERRKINLRCTVVSPGKGCWYFT